MAPDDLTEDTQDRVEPAALKAELLEIVRNHGYLRLDEPVRLRSGEMSEHFIDGKRALAHGQHLQLACRALLDLVAGDGIEFDAVGGLTMGADQFAHGAAMVGHKQWFLVRKERKGRGTNKLVEGADLQPGMPVLLVDDVVSTGGSIQQAYHGIAETGAEVVAAVTLVDRGEVAARFFSGLGVPYFPLLTYADLGIPAVGDGHPEPAATGS